MSDDRVGAPVPRVLALGLSTDEVDSIRPLVGSVRVIQSVSEVHTEEHDVLISGEGALDRAWEFPCRLIFAPAPPESTPLRTAAPALHSSAEPRTQVVVQPKPARDFAVGQFARDEGVVSLVEASCRPDTEARSYRGLRLAGASSLQVRPLLTEQLEYPLILAALVESQPEEWRPSSTLWLPQSARARLVDWVRFALGWWRRSAAETFPLDAEWHRAARWSSLGELAARQTLREADEAEEQRLAEVADRRKGLEAELLAAESLGVSWRMLLTDDGDSLVSAVAGALQFLGFEVVDVDALPERKGKKREDLRVSHDGWTALVEVKGYRGAAKSNDLQQVTAAAIGYGTEHGVAPNALWLVANAWRNEDPAQRERALGSREDDIDAFAEHHHGCFIDTRDLFALRQRVALGDVTPREARAALTGATGRFTYR
ncbi:hypothetical protein HUN58_05320 [Curtobacterium sp. Csp1]|uniref:hypothetical protein n=1 Tax=unclassified Curtobacterium TaxID=257496 RepID=UPI0015999054|nr:MULTISPECIES: hypothetical protein [unclassified Curtobacterium]QKS13197.1 hypothetical protein HUN60_08620 [Curtobacterium sp. csp3]QKS19420.1 hypothetical protein HUN58_05320 [Curtobacterium sp. Csp1]